MGNVLAEYPSKSKPGKSYHIILPNGGGELYCDCWQWKMKRTCSHLQHFAKKAVNKVPEFVKKAVLDLDTSKDALQHAIDAEVLKLAGM